MAKVYRAKNWLLYWAAFVISGVFSFFGKAGPAWAQDAQTQHNATVFQTLYQSTQGGSVPGRVQKPANSTGVQDGSPRAVFPPGSDRAVFPPGSDRAVFPPGSDRAVFPPGSMFIEGAKAMAPDDPTFKEFMNTEFSISKDKDMDPAWVNRQNERYDFIVNGMKENIQSGKDLTDTQLIYFKLMYKDFIEKSAK